MTQEFFIEAVKAGDEEEVHDFLDVPGVDPSENGNEAAKYAFANSMPEIFKEIVSSDKFKAGDDFDELLYDAVFNANAINIKLLLEAGVNPNMNNGILIRMLCKKGDEDTLKALLKSNKLNPNICHQAPMRIAKYYMNQEIVNILKEDVRVSSFA